jgi:hypothetical protein
MPLTGIALEGLPAVLASLTTASTRWALVVVFFDLGKFFVQPPLKFLHPTEKILDLFA